MKKLLLLVIFFVFTIYSASGIKLVSRSLATESVQLQLEYLGSCDHFTTYASAQVQFSKPTTTCLPIKDNVSDVGNLQADYFCSDIGPSRSIIHFVEVYETTDQVTENSFVFSIVSSRPFRAHVPVGSMAYARRPDCTVRKLFCIPSTLFVDSCSQNKVTLKKKYVLNSDRVYVAVNTNIGDTCKNILTCCTYVSATPTTGVCPSTAPNSLNRFPKKPSKPQPQHYEDEHEHDRHDNDRHDNEHDNYDNDRHDNEHDNYNNDRHDNNRHGNDRHDNNRPGFHREENNHQNNKKVEEETESETDSESVQKNNQKEIKEDQVKESDNEGGEEKKRNIKLN